MGLHIASQESLSSYLPHFSIARDKAEDAGNEYDNDTLVDLFLSSLGTGSTEFYSAQCSTLEYQRTDGKSIPFAVMEQKFLQLEEHQAPWGNSHQENAHLASLNPNPLAASNRCNGKPKPRHRADSSATTAKAIVCFGCNKPGHKKNECPERKEGNGTNVGTS
jgi:hypothetical protein